MMRAGVAALVLLVVDPTAGWALEGRAPIDVRRAERIRGASAEPPAPADPRWTPVTLPDWWGMADRRSSLEGWYRTTFELAARPIEIWAVYLPRIGQNAAVWVNRKLVGSSGDFAPPLSRNWNRPQLFTVPVALLRPGENEVLVRLATHIGAPGFLRGFSVGPARALVPRYEARQWRQITLGQIVGSATLGGGLLLLVFAMRSERFRSQRWLALGLVLWSWTSADAFVHHPPVANRWWEASTAAALVWCVVCFVVGFHRMIELVRPRVEWALVAAALAYTIALTVAPPIYGFALTVAGGGLAVGLALYLMLVLLRHPGPARPLRRILAVPAVVGAVFGLHDLAIVVLGYPMLGMILSPYIPVVAVVSTGWILLERHLVTLRETEALNAELEQRVAAKHRELAENYERLRALERRHAVVGERERIMQDMHDGMGGQLVSTLAMVESGGWSAEQVSEALRDALDELRIVIDSLDPGEQDLLTVLGLVRARLEPRLARHGVRFRWRVSEVPPLPGFGPEMALQVMRVVQEAITNVVKHAEAETITVRTGEADGVDGRPSIFVEGADDGCGLVPPPRAGRGLAGMRRRAARLGGRIEITSAPRGTHVRLWIPRGSAAADVRPDAERATRPR